MNYRTTAYLFLRVGLAFALLYPPFDALSNPNSWVGYIPLFLRGYVSDAVVLHTFGLLELVLALWILSGKRIFWPSLLSAGILLCIVFFNLNTFEVLFRDIPIAISALALALFSLRPPRKNT